MGEIEAHTHEFRAVAQDGAEQVDGPVQQRVRLVVVLVLGLVLPPPGGSDGGQTREEPDVDPGRSGPGPAGAGWRARCRTVRSSPARARHGRVGGQVRVGGGGEREAEADCDDHHGRDVDAFGSRGSRVGKVGWPIPVAMRPGAR